MANVIQSLKDRISERLTETKNPCKGYTTEQAAIKATKKVAEQVAAHHEIDDVNYIVFYHEGYGKWVGAIDMNGVLSHPEARGGYIGLACDKGFYTY